MIVMNIELTKFIGAEIHERDIMGKVQKCISIPIEENAIKISSSGRAFVDMSLNNMKPNKNNESYYISVIIRDKKKRERVRELGYDVDLKFIGKAANRDWRKRYFYNQKTNIDKILEE